MTDNKGTALVERKPEAMERAQAMAGVEIKTPQEYAERIRALQGQAHILSPMSAFASIAPSHVINPMIVVIDPSCDPETGRGADVYHQRSIHKGSGRGDSYKPLEVSLNKIGLQKILSAAGANVYPPSREFRERNWWIVTHEADVLTFDGRYVRLPPGTASVDLRDGSADIDEWTPEAWAEAERVAGEQRKRVEESERWKVKAAIVRADGSRSAWTRERVMQQRKFGLELAETKSLNRLARNLGIKQAYTIEELSKPFVIFRASYVPDLSNPRVAEMMAAASLGARHTMYPGASAPQQVPLMGEGAPISHAHGDPQDVLTGDIVPETPERMQTAAPPEGAEDVNFEEPPKPAEPVAAPLFHVTKVKRLGKDVDQKFFIETQEGITLYTPDEAIAKACATAAKDKAPREIMTERVVVAGQPYRQIVELTAAGGLKL